MWDYSGPDSLRKLSFVPFDEDNIEAVLSNGFGDRPRDESKKNRSTTADMILPIYLSLMSRTSTTTNTIMTKSPGFRISGMPVPSI